MNFFYKTDTSHISIKIWLSTLTFMTFLMIIIGGLTRLTDSGLSMVNWNPILGIIPPLNKNDWLSVFEAYKNSPEFIIINNSISLKEFKYIFWWEWFHRFFARFIGLVFLIPLIFFLIKKTISIKLLFTLIIIFIFGLFQAVVGWWMVKSGLNENPYVSPYRLTFHLMNGLVIFVMLFWTTLNFSSFYNKKKFKSLTIYDTLFLIGIGLLFITIISGGFMAGTHAGQSFNTYPLMNESLFPDDYILEGYGIRNLFENTVAVNFNHRWIASFTFIYMLSFIIYLLLFSKFKKKLIFPLMMVLLLTCLQFFLGIITLLSNVKISLASMHQVNSVLLLAFLLYSYYKFKNKINNET